MIFYTKIAYNNTKTIIYTYIKGNEEESSFKNTFTESFYLVRGSKGY